MKKIGITGASGYIGKALVQAGAFPILSDVTSPLVMRKEIEDLRPDIILHLASKSDPDFCEKDENKYIVSGVNVRGTHNVFLCGFELGIPCVLMSTGQIWRGGFWEGEHRESDKVTERSAPVNQYGLSKLAAEFIVKETFFESNGKIIRSSFVFDYTRLAAKLGFLREGVELYEPTFIKRSFIHLQDIVGLLLEYCERFEEMPNILHLAGKETVSWYEFARELACEFGYDRNLVRPRRTNIHGIAPRPGNAGLDTSLARSLGFRIPDFREGIREMAHETTS